MTTQSLHSDPRKILDGDQILAYQSLVRRVPAASHVVQ
jgi:hypothetical protein